MRSLVSTHGHQPSGPKRPALFAGVGGPQLEIVAVFAVPRAFAGAVGLVVLASDDAAEATAIELDRAASQVRLDRTRVELLPKPLLRRVTGVPCVVTSASEAKATLRLLRAASWHPPRHARLLLDADRSTSRRAFQLSDDGARALDDDARGGRALRRLLDEDSSSADGERADREYRQALVYGGDGRRAGGIGAVARRRAQVAESGG